MIATAKKAEKQARTFALVAEADAAAPVARIGGKDYSFTYHGQRAGYDLAKPDGTVYEVRRQWHGGALVWFCPCEGWTYSKSPAKRCKHTELGRRLGLIK